MTYFLPGQRYQWEADISVARWRGFFAGVILTLALSLLFDCLYLIPKIRTSVKVSYEAEVERLRASNHDLRDELGKLNGILVATYGKDTHRVIESYKGRRK